MLIFNCVLFCSTVCPERCECSFGKDGNMILDCSKAYSLGIPNRIPDKADNIVLSSIGLGNSDLKNDSFLNCTNVKKLDLSDNLISVVWNVVLISMPNLEIIVLDATNIRYIDSSFPDDTFAGLRHLKSVSIWCYILTMSMSHEEYAFVFRKLPLTLEELNVSIPGSGDISQPLSKFTKLRKLGIHGLTGTFNTITNDTFESLKNLKIKELNIMAFNLSSVEQLGFYHFPDLKSLSLSGIYCLSVADFYPALIGLQHTKLEKLHLSSNFIEEFHHTDLSKDHNFGADWCAVILNGSFCENLNLPHLTHLHLDHSRLSRVSYTNGSCFSKLMNLKVLNLSFNWFSAAESVQLFVYHLENMTNLTEINMSHQLDHMFVPPNLIAFRTPGNLATLDLSFMMPASENTWNCLLVIVPPPTYFKFQGNSVTVLQKFILGEINPSSPFEADFSFNNMISFEGSFDDAIRKYNLTVVSLILSENKLGKQLGERGDQIFKYFRDLTKLDLASNDIKQLPPSTFENLSKLEYLNLSKNSLLLIDFKISHMKNLKLLDLSDNLVSQFNVTQQNDIKAVKFHSPNFTIIMLGNPFQCSCETLSFLWWLYEKRPMFDGFDKYTCTYNGEIQYFKNMTQLLTTIDSRCSLIFVEVFSGILAFLIFVIALSVFLYRHKWDVRFFFLRYVTNRKAYQELEESEKEYEYDAFVSFNGDDQDWVWNELHENLGRTEDLVETDNQPRYRLCIHERDFVPGDLIEENILRSIESSRKTIVVLSRNFLQSVWCEFELQIARKLCVDRGRDLIIAVMLEPLPTNVKISQCVERLVRKNTYIEWPTDPHERNQFWVQMRSALSKRMMNDM